MRADPRIIEDAKRRVLEYFDPKPPPQEDCLNSGLVKLVNYYMYEGADVRGLLFDLAIVIADTLATRNQRLEVQIIGAQVVLANDRDVYLNISGRIDDEWHKLEPNADLVASRIESELVEQLRFAQQAGCTEPGDGASVTNGASRAPGR